MGGGGWERIWYGWGWGMGGEGMVWGVGSGRRGCGMGGIAYKVEGIGSPYTN